MSPTRQVRNEVLITLLFPQRRYTFVELKFTKLALSDPKYPSKNPTALF